MRDVKKFRRSFRYAYEGLKYALSTQQNMQFHFSVALLALIMAIGFKLPKAEILFILSAVTLVIVCELINTAVEKAVDLAMPDRHPLAKIAKDVAAAAVLVSAVFAAIVGMVVFYEPLDLLIRQAGTTESVLTPGLILTLVALVALIVIVAQTRFSDKRFRLRPSLLTAVSFAISTWIALLTANSLIALLGYGLSIQLTFVLYDKRSRQLPALVAGAVIGSAMTALAFYLILA
ncbi:diacylglycerol kinase family protein [Paenibacillus hemerocallicola]|uniref:Diacylglycerol kinase family protein n=1 Tax=Paenibacillus hemerocallicola TaxID=1172614 RepID=A0A5C4T4X4_9BACL|nr:diacylglycerol kinase family protein [Paenibacillus hemerocallicola]TNJ64141.1 diacylglycerol kinase family protein [Paenibacillus hemerocallicola]